MESIKLKVVCVSVAPGFVIPYKWAGKCERFSLSLKF